MSDALLSVQNLEAYYGPVMALRGVSIEVNRAEIVAILGANGVGKTTLLKTISGIVEAHKGQVILERQTITRSQPDAIVRGGVAHVPQGRDVFPLLSVVDNLMLGAYTRSDRHTLATDLELVFEYFPALLNRQRQLAGTLSGGQQQMLAIARGLMMRPHIILLDEPSLGLSPKLIREIYQIIARLNRELGVALLVVEQNAQYVLDIASRGYVLELGRVVFDGSREKLLNTADIQEFFLGKPTDNGAQIGRWKRKKTWR
ncbi:MAG: ABC transporter ATP-binding protein [Pseudomonadota bacterium]